MDSQFSKLDVLLFKATKAIILRGVKKSKMKLNKFYVLKKMLNFGLATQIVLVCCMPAVSFILKCHVIITGIAAFFAVIEVLDVLRIRNRAERNAQAYDILFQNRKDPRVYKHVKEVTHEVWAAFKEKRLLILKLQVLRLCFYFGLTIPSQIIKPDIFIVLGFMILVETFCDVIENYALYVFDFDPPKKRRSPKKASLTELMKKQFERWKQVPGLVPT